MKEWMSEGFRRPPAPEDNPSMCLWGEGNDWDIFCERCGYSASEIESQDSAEPVASKHQT